jgi:hypothetical protein
MSRYDIPTRAPGLLAVVGWDNPLQTYFGQVLRPETADYDDDNVLLWVGAAPREVITVEDLARHLAPFAELAPQVADQLRADRAAKLEHSPTAVQQVLLSIVTRAK